MFTHKKLMTSSAIHRDRIRIERNAFSPATFITKFGLIQ